MNSTDIMCKLAEPTQREIASHKAYYCGREHRAKGLYSVLGDMDVVSVLQQALENSGESATRNITYSGSEVLLCQNGNLVIECCSSQTENTLHSIFSGHRRINDAVREKSLEGRWKVQIQRNYCDGSFVNDACSLLDTIPLHTVPAKGVQSNGIAILPISDGEQWRGRNTVAGQLPQDTLPCDGKRTPSSTMMSGGALVYIEGPWFYPYETIGKILEAVEERNNEHRCTLLAIDADEFSTDTHELRRRVAAMIASMDLSCLAGVLYAYRAKWGAYSGEVAVEFVGNPSGAIPLPQYILDVLQLPHRRAS